MLRIYPVCLKMVREVAVLVLDVRQHDRDLCKQLQRSSVSVVLNLAEGSAVRDGRRRVRYGDALGSALETRAGIEVASALGYIDSVDDALLGRFRHIIGVLYKVSR